MKKAGKCSELPPAALKISSWSRVEDNFILKSCHVNFCILLVTLLLSKILQYLKKNYLRHTFSLSVSAVSRKMLVLYTGGIKVHDFPITFHFMMFPSSHN